MNQEVKGGLLISRLRRQLDLYATFRSFVARKSQEIGSKIELRKLYGSVLNSQCSNFGQLAAGDLLLPDQTTSGSNFFMRTSYQS
jgi:hypothetical protein